MATQKANPNAAQERPNAAPQRPDSGQMRSYLGSVAMAGVALAMQQLLLVWLLMGSLGLPADRVGLLQGLIGVPGVLLMLWGGAHSDRGDPRSLLVKVYLVSALFPLGLVVAQARDGLSVGAVFVWGLLMSCSSAYSSPAQHAMLNRVSGGAVQRGVSAATAIGFVVQIAGLIAAGQLGRLGLTTVLAIQAGAMATAGLLMSRVPRVDGSVQANGRKRPRVWRDVVVGLRATVRNRVVFDVLLLNFVSGIFNAGAFLTVLPFIVRQDYGGDAALLSALMIVFFVGATISNLVMMRVMPLAHPGRWFVVMQLSRILILFLLWMRPGLPLVYTTLFLWGLNMGVTQTLARSVVQESAEPELRGRILSVFSLGVLGSPLIGATVLGWIVAVFGTTSGLVPSMVTSLLLFAYAVRFTPLWSYLSPETEERA